MAGDWIKFEHTTPDKPEVVRMAASLHLSQDAVVGKLLRVWIWADQNSVAGTALGITDAFIDRLTGKRGFSTAMRDAGWLSGDDGGLVFSNFERNNGASAKARAMDNRKKASQRQREKRPDNVPMPSGQIPGPEKRREEKSILIQRARLPELLDTPAMRDAWDRWLAHWSTSFANGRPMPEQTAHSQLRELLALGPDRAIAAIENAITKGGLRKPCEPFNSKTNHADNRTPSSRGFSQQNDYSGVSEKL